MAKWKKNIALTAHSSQFELKKGTLPETNIAPENGGFQ